MKYIVASLVGSTVLALLSGCGSSVAAPVQQTPTQPQVAVSLAPPSDVISDNPIRIPEGRKTSLPAIIKPVTVVSKNQGVAESNDDQAPAPTPELERKQEKQERQDRTNRKNGMRQDGRSFEKKQDDKPRTDRFEKVQVEKKSVDEPAKPAASTPVSTETLPPTTQGNLSSDSVITPAPAPTSVPPVVSTTTTPTASAAPVSFSVTYGSSASANSRNFKKPSLPSGLPSWFTDNDKDGDGQLTMNEWPGDRFEEFTKYDRNGDGIITIEEAMKTVPKVVVAPPAATTPATTTTAAAATPATSTAAAPPKVVAATSNPAPAGSSTPMSDEEAKRSAERVFSFVDSNKDGFLDEKEIANTQSIKNVDWKKYDVNKDGKLDINEAIALYKAEGANLRRGGMGGGGWGNMSPDDRFKMMFDNADKSKTGKISKEQFPGFWRDRFAEFDTNKDGFVDFEEFKVGAAKLMPGGGRGGPGGGGGDNGGRGGRGGDNGGRGGRGGFGGGNG
ncbi:MAG TPA: EF-hand domain-containing protein [Gemmatales bacterium]|nr:EF-hand domain-containing protein [Gemmatales bacterium]